MRYNHSNLPVPPDAKVQWWIPLHEHSAVILTGLLYIRGQRYHVYQCCDEHEGDGFGYSDYILTPISFKEWKDYRSGLLSLLDLMDKPGYLARTRHCIDVGYDIEMRFLSQLPNGMRDIPDGHKPYADTPFFEIKYPQGMYTNGR